MQKFFFILFILLFLIYPEGDVINYLQSCIVGHPLTAHPFMSALVLVIFLATILHFGEKILNKHHIESSPIYVFCSWLVVAGTSYSFVSWQYQLILFLSAIAIVFLIHFVKKAINVSLGSTLWKNAQATSLQFLILFLYIGIGNGVTDVHHFELRTAQVLIDNKPNKGRHIGEKSYATSQRLFSMRCYLLAKSSKHGLGNEFLEQVVPQAGAASLLFPNDKKQQLLISQDSLYNLLGSTRFQHEPPIAYLRRCAWNASLKNSKNKHAAIDYYLCGLLLDKNLDVFANEVKRFYPHKITSGTLPTYFAQALILYKHTRTQPKVFYTDNSIEANFQDYSDMGDTIPNKLQRSNMLRRSYGTTYWWWYYYGKH